MLIQQGKNVVVLQYIIKLLIKNIDSYDKGDKNKRKYGGRNRKCADKKNLPGRIKKSLYDAKKYTSRVCFF